MKTPDELKEIVRQKYGEIVKDESCGCGCGCEPESAYTIFSDNYESKEGYVKDADYGLGCGIPSDHAGIMPGNHVLDLGSGAGNDCFVARALVGDKGKVTGLDFTDEMIRKAEINNMKLGYHNVEFVKGDIEKMPLTDSSFDVVISNCVLNLVPDKKQAFSEIRRVIKPGGHFSISDVVLQGDLPPELAEAAELYAGCVSGAIQKDAYLDIIRKAGFTGVEVKTEKEIHIPDSLLLDYISKEDLDALRNRNVGIYSITVFGSKPIR